MVSVVKTNESTQVELAKQLQYMSGFANEHCSEALPGALPEGQFSPQKVAYGLYAEKFSASAFTAPRSTNFRNWFYRIRPSVVHGNFERIDNGLIRSGPITEIATPPNQLRWDPLSISDEPLDFIDGLVTVAANGKVGVYGIGIHMYLANQSMQERFFYNSDGELLIVPQQGTFRAHTECGVLEVKPGEICVIPRGIKFRVVLPDGPSRGYVCENYGGQLQLPERGPVGSDGYANDRDFLAPVAAYEDKEGDYELVNKFMGNLYRCDIGHSPLDVVAWLGTAAPYKYDLARFNTMNSVTYDHPDPSIFTVLTSQSDTAGIANVDFVIFPPRWVVTENTFRPPWYHRNVMSEFMGLINGMYDAKAEGFVPGGASLHNCMSAHGPDAGVFDGASNAELAPKRYEDTMAFMFESRYIIQPTKFALESEHLQKDYIDCWQGLKKNFKV